MSSIRVAAVCAGLAALAGLVRAVSPASAAGLPALHPLGQPRAAEEESADNPNGQPLAAEEESARAADVQKKFANGHLAVHGMQRQQVDDPYQYKFAKGQPTLVDIMKGWSSTGRFWAGAPVSQIRPEYRDHPIFGQIGYVVDWTKCRVRFAAAFDVASTTSKMAGTPLDRFEHFLDIAERISIRERERKYEEDSVLNTKRISKHAYVVVPKDDPYKLDYKDLERRTLPRSGSRFKGLLVLDGKGKDEKEVYDELNARLLEDVSAAYVGNTSTVGGYVHTEMAADCPLDALEGLIVSLRGWNWLWAFARSNFHNDVHEEVKDDTWTELFRQERTGHFDLSYWRGVFGVPHYLQFWIFMAGPAVVGTGQTVLRDLYDAALKWKTLISQYVPSLEKELPVFYLLPEVPGWSNRAVSLAREREWAELDTPTSLVHLGDGDALSSLELEMSTREQNRMEQYKDEQFEVDVDQAQYLPYPEVPRMLDDLAYDFLNPGQNVSRKMTTRPTEGRSEVDEPPLEEHPRHQSWVLKWHHNAARSTRSGAYIRITDVEQLWKEVKHQLRRHLQPVRAEGA